MFLTEFQSPLKYLCKSVKVHSLALFQDFSFVKLYSSLFFAQKEQKCFQKILSVKDPKMYLRRFLFSDYHSQL